MSQVKPSQAIEAAPSSPVPAPANETTAIILMIERAARDPAVDIDKMQRLFEMHEKATLARARTEYLAAFARLQAELPAVERKGTGHNNKRYARFEDLIATIRAPLAQHGFSLSFRIDQEDGKVRITGVLGHAGGHQEATSLPLPADKSGSKNDVQAWGSAISYGKRYVALTLLGIATEDEDDDGQKAGKTQPSEPVVAISPAQLDTLREMIEASGADIKGVCTYYKIARIDDLPAARFGHAMAKLEERMKR